jgi:RimJ/RimL family protein N-acetyltransferase
MNMHTWPLFGLRLRTPRLDLHLPSLDELDELAGLAAEGIHDPAVMPFDVPWTDAEPAERARQTVQHHWGTWSAWKPENWVLNLVAVMNGTVVGTQGLRAKDFAVVHEVSTGSWLGLRHQGRGLGTEMRAAVLHLAFAELGAEYASSGAFLDNAASLAVSRKLGYQTDGLTRQRVRNAAVTQQRLRLSRAGWEKHRLIPVEVEGLNACMLLFGLG